jgi:hypothetical protein
MTWVQVNSMLLPCRQWVVIGNAVTAQAAAKHEHPESAALDCTSDTHAELGPLPALQVTLYLKATAPDGRDCSLRVKRALVGPGAKSESYIADGLGTESGCALPGEWDAARSGDGCSKDKWRSVNQASAATPTYSHIPSTSYQLSWLSRPSTAGVLNTVTWGVCPVAQCTTA